MVRPFETWVDALFDLLLVGEDVLAVIRATTGPPPGFPIPLVEGDLSPEEALDYARTLAELGREPLAREILAEVVRHAAGERPPLAPPLAFLRPAVAA